MSAHGHENLHFDPFLYGGRVINVVYLLGQLYQWLLMLSDYTKAS